MIIELECKISIFDLEYYTSHDHKFVIFKIKKSKHHYGNNPICRNKFTWIFLTFKTENDVFVTARSRYMK